MVPILWYIQTKGYCEHEEKAQEEVSMLQIFLDSSILISLQNSNMNAKQNNFC